MEAVKTFGSLALVAVMFAGWPVLLFMLFHARQHGAIIVVGLSILTFFIGSAIASIGASLHSPFLLYGWLALPYLLAGLLFLRRKQAVRRVPNDP